MSERTSTILVGVDGSPGSQRAIDWAADEAALHGWDLDLVYAHFIDDPYGYVQPDTGHDLPEFLEAHRQRVQESWPNVAVSAEWVRGSPKQVLVERSAGAAMTVVGSSGHSWAQRLALGSVGRHVGTHAQGVTVVVRALRPEHGLPVVVGIDDSQHLYEVLARGCDEAQRRGAKLVVVHAWDVAPADPYGTFVVSAEVCEQVKHEAEAFVHQAVAGIRGDVPDLEIETKVVRGHPTAVTLALSEAAQLLVLGSHGRHWYEGVVAGSTASAAVHQADCPVMLVRHD